MKKVTYAQQIKLDKKKARHKKILNAQGKGKWDQQDAQKYNKFKSLLSMGTR